VKKEIQNIVDPTSPNPSKGGELADEVLGDSSREGEESKLPGYITANLQNYKYLNVIRTGLKEQMTDSEKLIWKYLQNKQTGHKIRRQHVIDNFIVDFVCLNKKVIIEIDGKIHLQQKVHDQLRTNTLNEKGYYVIRFSNEEVLANPELVTSKIKAILDNR